MDYSGYHLQTQKHLSILTINQLNLSDEGIYMCKSNQHQYLANIFNITVLRMNKTCFQLFIESSRVSLASLKIFPNDGILELHPSQRSINLSCTVRDSTLHSIDPLNIKWFHNKHEINYQRNSHLINKYSVHNQATLILYIHNLSLNDTGSFTCDYNDGLISKNVQILYTNSSRFLVVIFSSETNRTSRLF